MFLRKKAPVLLKRFIDLNFLISLVYLEDVFGILNSLNISLQGTEMNILMAE